MASLNPYGKFDQSHDQEMLMARRQTRKRVIIIFLSTIVLVAAVVGIAVGLTQGKNVKYAGDNKYDQSILASIKAACAVTLYPDACYNSLFPFSRSGNIIRPKDIYKLSVQVAINEVVKVSDNLNQLNITDCQQLLSLALDHLNSSLSPSITVFTSSQVVDDFRTWLSSAGTYQQTCIDGFEEANNSTLTSIVKQILKNSTEYTSNSLAIVTSLESLPKFGSIGRRLMSFEYDDGPSWLSSNDRKLLQANPSTIQADAVVAKDGTGNYTTITAALAAVPNNGDKRFVIYVKEGVYVENVRVEKTKTNVTMIGDGMDATIVSGSLNFVDKTPTFRTATFAVIGKGFIARDMGFINSAGAVKHQAVALMSTADSSVFYRCRMNAYQDTLYTHSNRQFYRDCIISGTVDFIFGNSAVVFQNCTIQPRKPMAGQQNTITAQGKFDPNQNTGISIQNCNFSPAENLTGVSTFLGRPWKNYSTTVYMQNVMEGFIDPEGWLPWSGTTTAPPTIFYAEYGNTGPGAVTQARVNWSGLKLNLSAQQAEKFTVNSFIDGTRWLPVTSVIFKQRL